MILYLDASALVKRYIQEKESRQVNTWIGEAEMVVTGLISRVEVAAVIGRAGRMRIITADGAQTALKQFRSEWESYLRLPINEIMVARGDVLAVEHDLRGYDATHLATAMIWQENIGKPVTLASFDLQLINAAKALKMAVLPG